MALWYMWSTSLTHAENKRRAVRFFELNARLRWKNPPLRRIGHYTRREKARLIALQHGRIVLSCGRRFRLRSWGDPRR